MLFLILLKISHNTVYLNSETMIIYVFLVAQTHQPHL